MEGYRSRTAREMIWCTKPTEQRILGFEQTIAALWNKASSEMTVWASMGTIGTRCCLRNTGKVRQGVNVPGQRSVEESWDLFWARI